MDKNSYFEVLDLFKNYCDLCIDDFEMLTLEEQNTSFLQFVNDFDNCSMDKYLSKLWGEMASARESWSDYENKQCIDLLFRFNLLSDNGIEY